MQILKAELADIERLLGQFNSYRAFYKRKAAPDKARDFLKENLATGRSIIFLAENDQGQVIGFIQLYSRVSSLSMTPYIYISDLYVDESHRQFGVGKKLMKRAEEYGIASGASSLQLETAHSNKPAQSLYESLSYVYEQEYRNYSLTLPTPAVTSKLQHPAASCRNGNNPCLRD